MMSAWSSWQFSTQQPEFVPAQAGERIPLAEQPVQQSADAFQQFIPRGMPGGVVDDLELVEIQVTQDVGEAALLRALQRPFQAVFEFAAVDQPGQAVVHGVMGNLQGQAPLLGHVMEDEHHSA